MKLRYKAPSGGGTIEVDDAATVAQLLETVKSTTGFADVTVKYGWPPQALGPDQHHVALQTLGLQRESLTVVPVENLPTEVSATPQAVQASKSAPGIKDQNISVLIPESNSSLVLRVMPDDNSCLFTAVGGALRGLPPSPDGYTPGMLRRIVTDHIRSNPSKFNAAVLESSPDAYCTRMMRPDTWGGAMELGILSEEFNLEICVVDVKTGAVIRYGEGNYDMRCIMVYSNIHYDRIAEIFVEGQEEMDFDVTRWAVETSDHLITRAQEMCKELKEKHQYFTDTSAFVVTCNECGWIGQGEQQLIKHARDTGHSDITEIKDK
ncbi:Uu.00g138380.m01.CDS01 [Anthostomella pinea]|uniref:Ubiquitin thioesterase OTU n=1 Tax=Anthostomella pinea TaxID=933095 RepID=A0AAI8VPR1_9PEZI|nr:Uu.00g138380.m01.CDS01 [Anthostomella pinea]